MAEDNKSSKLKMSNEKSMFNRPEQPNLENFEMNASQAFQKYELRKRKCAELSSKFINALNDLSLPENKNPIAKNLERELLSDLISIAIEINTDESESEGMGSVAVITLLLNSLLKQRDKINELSFRLNKVETELKLKK